MKQGLASMPDRIDAHAHVFDRRLKPVASARYVPEYDASLATYLAFLDANGLARGMLVQPSFLGSDNSFLVDALEKAGGRLTGVVVAETEASIDALPALARAGAVGLRFNLIGRAPEDIASVLARRALARAEGLGWHAEIHADAPALSQAMAVLPAFDGPIVIDHCGRPAADDEMAGVAALAADPRVVIKLSGPYRFAMPARAAAGRLLDAFGPDRLVWGSDWPWTQFEAVTSFAAIAPARFGLDGATLAAIDETARRLFFPVEAGAREPAF